MKQWYEAMFENYANNYEQQPFTKGTLQEVDFIEDEIGKDKSIKILDIGCGTGRHSIELAKRGYDVTGFDLSESQINYAIEKARVEKLNINFFRLNALDLNFKEEFDLGLILCEGAFPLLETDEMNYKILVNAAKSLRKNGKLILTTLNALFPLYNSTSELVNEGSTDFVQHESNFDLMTFRDKTIFEVIDDSGIKKTLNSDERYYAPSEITWLLKSAGFIEVDIFGCDTGNFERGRKLTAKDFEMLVIAQK